MTKTKCRHCNKKFITAAHAKSHEDIAHPQNTDEEQMRRGWATPYGFVDFVEPVTYEYAHSFMQRHHVELERHFAEKEAQP